MKMNIFLYFAVLIGLIEFTFGFLETSGLRDWLQIRLKAKILRKWINCDFCLSFWIASPIIYTHGVVEWLGVAGASAILARAFPPRD